jgi:hypothetical protein
LPGSGERAEPDIPVYWTQLVNRRLRPPVAPAMRRAFAARAFLPV